MSEPREAALAYAAAGIYVFPVHVTITDDGKKKADPVGRWRDTSTTDAKTIRKWWAPGSPWAGASLAIDCGKSHLVVLDPDGDDGLKAWAELVDTHGLPATFRASTPGGGEHWYYAENPRRVVGIDSSGKVAEHVDVRGMGGFVFAPPSTDARGVYRWLEGVPEWGSLPTVPDLVADRMNGKKAEDRKPEPATPDEFMPPSRGFTPEQAWQFAAPALDALRAAKDGQINHRLNDAAIMLNHFVPAFLKRAEAEQKLGEALSHTVYDGKTWKAENTIASGLDAHTWKAEQVEEDDGVPEEGEEKPKEKSASTVLVEIARERYTFGVGDNGETFGVPKVGPKVVQLLRGGKTSLRNQLARTYFARRGKTAPQAALADALLVIEGDAQEAAESRLHMRVARHGGALWLDLGDQTGRAVEITGEGWTVKESAPVLFKRTALTGALPVPQAGGKLSELWEWLNVTGDDRPLLAAWLVAVLHADIPHPVLGLFGEQGTGKTTALKVLVSLLDPSPVPTRKPPRDADSWVTAATGSWVVGLDNLSDMPSWLSDAICRAVTGDGDVRRRLYTDGDFAVFAFRRAIAITGIDLGALRGDLAERLLPIELTRISDDDRLEEEQLWPEWDQAHPRLLGGFLDLVARIEHIRPFVDMTSKPRMADFARLLKAVDEELSTDGFTRYLLAQGSMARESLTSDLFVTAIEKAVKSGQFVGTSGELLHQVTPVDENWRAPKGWPSNPRQVTTLLRRQAAPMRKTGWTVEDDGGNNKSNAVRWTIAPPRDGPEADSPDSPDSLPQVSKGESFRQSVGEARKPDSPDSPDSPTPSNGESTTSALTSEYEQASQASLGYEPSLFGDIEEVTL